MPTDIDRHRIFTQNLAAIQRVHQQSLGEFAAELGIPKSTLTSVLEQGNTTLNTALRISEGLKLPLDALTGDELLPQKLSVAQYLLQSFTWFEALPADEQGTVVFYLGKILEIIRK